ncbi:unnamed protein product [Bursaphelenchus xylophilus]|uniref:(pine wood nematode) hypothetical protein n=1 Tax=Bursaphelenchus xylophilus TaxID=6326 RepID=A0A7I8WJR2_BURXY|nr:unnamed protein product [Bursaphelenchus xylophilus]CAG9107646.1 unnamed protein product [Bursaphelenchus xylophilus]
MLDPQNPQAKENILLQTLLDRYPNDAEEENDHHDEQAESASTSSKYNGTSENGRTTQSPVNISGDVAFELTKQLSFKPCACHDCLKCIHKYLPDSEQSSSRGNSVPCTPNPLAFDLMNNMVKTYQKKDTDEVEYLEDGTVKRGRKSKYCTPERKKQVAAYAELYGATAASKAFGIPAAVSAYYHRKLRKIVIGDDEVFNSLKSMNPPQNGSYEDQKERISGSFNPASPSVSTTGFLSNPQLRGRGRGRPKLIGDDLDAELVEHMVGVKKRVPRGHLTASYALEVARGYIASKQPSLLEENGGPINLKTTWAMKLVARTNERYHELYGNGNCESVDDLLANLGQVNEDVNPTSAPEIRNIRSLDLSFAFHQTNKSQNEETENLTEIVNRQPS